MTSLREVSGYLSDSAKWQNVWDVLSSANCDIQSLRIYHNSAHQLKATCGRLLCNSSVTALDIGVAEGDGCNALAELLAVNRHIISLRIQSLSISDSDAVALSAGLQANSSIQQLTLHNLQPTAVLQVSKALSTQNCSCQLQQLKLPGARLDTSAAAALNTAVMAQPKLTLLSLQSATFLAAAAAQLTTSALASHPSLIRLELQQASGLDPAALGGYLASAASPGHNCALQAVLLDDCSVQDAGVQQLATAAATIFAALSKQQLSTARQQCNSNHVTATNPSGLKELGLGSNSIGLEGAKAFGELLGAAGFEQLAILNLNQNNLEGEGVAQLVQGLCAGGGCCNLQELHLECNSIKGVGGLVTLLTCPAVRSLQTLSLSNNCIADEATCQLAAAITSSNSTTLQHINLSSNWIKDEGAECLAGMLKSHRTLATLHLHKNRIGPKGIDALILAAFANSTLQHMDLSGNRIRDQRTKLDIEGLGRALAARRQGVSSSRRASGTMIAAQAAVSDVELPAAAAAAAVGSTDGERNRRCSSGSSSPGGGSRDKQSLEDRRSSDDSSSTEAVTAAMVAATTEISPLTGRAAKLARHDSDKSVQEAATTAAALAAASIAEASDAAATILEASTVDYMCYELGSTSSPLVSCSSNSDVLGPSPFACQAQQCDTAWDDSPSGPAAAASATAGFPQPQNTSSQLSDVGTSDSTVREAEQDGRFDDMVVEEYSMAGLCKPTGREASSSSSNSASHTRIAALHLSGPPGAAVGHEMVMSAVKAAEAEACSSGLQDFFLPVGFVQKLKQRHSRSYSFDFWARSNSSSRNSSMGGSDMDTSCTTSHGPLLHQGSLVCPELNILGPGNLSLVNFLVEPSSPCSLELTHAPIVDLDTVEITAFDLLTESGLSRSNTVGSLSGWMLDDAFTGRVMLAGLLSSNSSSMSGASSLSGALKGKVARSSSNAEQFYSCSGDGVTDAAVGGSLASAVDHAGSSGSAAAAPAAVGAVRRLNSGGVLVKKASLTGASARAALVAAGSTRTALSRFGRAAAAQQ